MMPAVSITAPKPSAIIGNAPPVAARPLGFDGVPPAGVLGLGIGVVEGVVLGVGVFVGVLVGVGVVVGVSVGVGVLVGVPVGVSVGVGLPLPHEIVPQNRCVCCSPMFSTFSD